MGLKKAELAIINRSFWPVYPVIGEALLRFAEKQAVDMNVCVILQDHAGIRTQLQKQHRGVGVNFYPCKALSVSGSGIVRRIADAAFFMVWVFFVLLWTRPAKVYVSTDPPVLVPFIVMVYSKLFRAKYIYHLQDIHPEATNVVIPVNKILFSTLRWLDALVIRQASLIITITKEMAEEIRERSSTVVPVYVLSNPAVSFDDVIMPQKKKAGFSFCGNAGRLQRMPLLINAIEVYCNSGGSLPFIFAGGGIFSEALKVLANNFANVTYSGVISATEAAQLSADYQWALLPIEDGVTRYAFPSKTSSYVFSGACVAAICGSDTSVAAWVRNNALGVVISPDVDSLCLFFQQVERSVINYELLDMSRFSLKKSLEFDVFIAQLEKLIVSLA